jgi:hypothetical protein
VVQGRRSSGPDLLTLTPTSGPLGGGTSLLSLSTYLAVLYNRLHHKLVAGQLIDRTSMVLGGLTGSTL